MLFCTRRHLYFAARNRPARCASQAEKSQYLSVRALGTTTSAACQRARENFSSIQKRQHSTHVALPLIGMARYKPISVSVDLWESTAAASAAGLRSMTDTHPGIRREQRRTTFVQRSANGRLSRDAVTLCRITALVIPLHGLMSGSALRLKDICKSPDAISRDASNIAITPSGVSLARTQNTADCCPLPRRYLAFGGTWRAPLPSPGSYETKLSPPSCICWHDTHAHRQR
jgi:hypothetical protein